jgi:hypothetical protein
MPTATPIGDEASTAVFSTTTPGAEGPFTGQEPTGARTLEAGLVVEPERQSATSAGFDMAEDRP